MGFESTFLDKNGQVATEYLMLVGICLIIIAALSAYSFIQYGDSVSNSQALNATRELKDAANKVYGLGDGSSILTTIIIPSDVTVFAASQKSLQLTTTTFGSPSTDIIEFDFNVSGTLPTSAGTYTIAVLNDNGVVVFSEV